MKPAVLPPAKRIVRMRFDLRPVSLGAPPGRAAVARIHVQLPDGEISWATGEEEALRVRPTVVVGLDPALADIVSDVLGSLPHPPRVVRVGRAKDLIEDPSIPEDGVCMVCAAAGDATVATQVAHLREAHPAWSIVVILAGDVPLSIGLAPLRAGADDVLTAAELDVDRLARTLHAARARRRQERELRGDAERIRSVVDALAHDIRAPLATCDWLLEELMGQLPAAATAEADKTAARIRYAFEGVERLVEDVLVLARLDGRRRRRERVDVTEAVREVSRELEADVRRRGAELTFDLPPEGTAILRGANSEVRTLFRNLLTNAIKYGDTDACRVHVAGFQVQRNRQKAWRFEVSDNGPGVAPNLTTQVFEPFFRAPDAAARREPGTGLGLAIAAGVAKAHGFRLDVARGPLGGAMFIVEVPSHRMEGGGLLHRPATLAAAAGEASPRMTRREPDVRAPTAK